MEEKSDRNALAELAEWMAVQVDAFPVMANQFAEQDKRDRENAQKIQRIVAELAKHEKEMNRSRTGLPFAGDAVMTIVKCHEIAKE